MNKKIKSLLIAAALTLPVLAATTATAGPDCDNPKLADNPHCPPTTTTTSVPDLGSSCAESIEQGHQVFSETDEFEIVVNPGEVGCVDWTTTMKTNWLVTVSPGSANSVRFNVRDSHPGDFCWLDTLGIKDIKTGLNTLTITHSNGPLANGGGPLPISSVGACGTWDDEAPSFVFTISPSGKPSPVTISVTAID